MKVHALASKTESVEAIRTLQIGDEWFEERPGGLGRVFYELSQHLPEIGVDFRGLVVGGDQVLLRHGKQIEVFAKPNEPLAQRLFKARLSVRRAVKSKLVDLVACHFCLYTFPALLEIRQLPLVIHFHGPWAAEGKLEKSHWLKSQVQALVEKAVYKRGDRFIVLSSAFANELIRLYSIPRDLIRIVPAGVDTVRFNCKLCRKEAREQLMWPTDRFIVITVRRLAQRMGLEDLISAAKLLERKAPEILFYIAGSGRLSDELNAQIVALGLRENVKLLGRLDDALLPTAYRAADLSVVPTVALEGFGMITLESLASGTPVMVTPVGGLPEVVQKLSPALIFESTGSQAIANAIEQVFRGTRKLPDEQECRNYVISTYTWGNVATKVRDVYEEVLDR